MNTPNSTSEQELDAILSRFLADTEDELDSFKRPNELLLIREKAKAAITAWAVAQAPEKRGETKGDYYNQAIDQYQRNLRKAA